ncbi:unnamed protein product [Phaeothamnion confervicola]
MYRVVFPTILSFVLGACSLGAAKPLSFGFGDNAAAPATKTASVRGNTAGLGGEPSTSRPTAANPAAASPKVASAVDRAPKDSFDRAPAGSLADRDYSSTSLEATSARDAINAYRKTQGLKPLTLNAELTTAAKAHARDLAKWDRISHYGSDGSNPWDRVKRAGYNAKVAAENVGTGQINFSEVLKGWRESPGHNKNLLMNDVEHIGIALVQDPKTEFKTFWVLALGARM